MTDKLFTPPANRTARILLLVTGALIFSYTLSRACLLAITWDEAYSYLQFVRNGVVLPEQYDEMSANNHLLNTFLNLHLTRVFGLSGLILRVPALLGHLLFLFFSARILLDIPSKWLILAAFLVIQLNPYLLDFFSMARGYGLSLGLMMASLYYFYRMIRSENTVLPALSMLFACLAVTASLVMLNYCLALLCAMGLLTLMRCLSSQRKILFFLKQMTGPLLIFICMLLLILPFALHLKEAKALFFGGSESFWTNTIGTVIDRCFYDAGHNYWLQRIAKGLLILVLIHAAFFVAWRIRRKELQGNSLVLFFMLLLLLVSAVSTVLQHHLMGTLYLIDRTALFLVVLFNVVLVFQLVALAELKKRFRLLIYAAMAPLLIHFMITFNLSYVLEWKFDADTKAALKDLEKMKQLPPGRSNISIGIPFWFEPGINFYRDMNDLTWLNTAIKGDLSDPMYDYLYLTPADLQRLGPDSIEVLFRYAVTGNVLAKPRYRPGTGRLAFADKVDFSKYRDAQYVMEEAEEFGPQLSYVLNDSIASAPKGIVQVTAEVQADDLEHCNAGLVISFQDKNTALRWQRAWMRDYINKENEWTEVTFSCIVPAAVRRGDELKSYIWNPDKQVIRVRKLQMEWISYDR